MFPPLSAAIGTHADESNIRERLSVLADAGAKRIMLDASHLKRVIVSPIFRRELEEGAKEAHIEISDVHAPHDMNVSLGFPLPGAEYGMLASGLTAIRTSAELGARTVTFHTARTRLTAENTPSSGAIEHADVPAAKERILRQLEVLLKEAEKCHILLALENLFLPSSTAEVITEIVKTAAHPNLGLCYDSGHALLMEDFPGKESSMIASWIRCGWDGDTIVFQSDQLDTMLPYVFTAHLHDNHGCNDEHVFPGEGRADWAHIIERLKKAPKLVSLQNEVLSQYFEDDITCQIRNFRNAGFNI